MPTQIYQVTDSPVNLIGANDIDGNALTLTVGQTYSARYVTSGRAYSFLKVLEASTAPDADDPGLPVLNKEDLIIEPVTGEGVYVWNADGIGRLIINEAG